MGRARPAPRAVARRDDLVEAREPVPCADPCAPDHACRGQAGGRCASVRAELGDAVYHLTEAGEALFLGAELRPEETAVLFWLRRGVPAEDVATLPGCGLAGYRFLWMLKLLGAASPKAGGSYPCCSESAESCAGRLPHTRFSTFRKARGDGMRASRFASSFEISTRTALESVPRCASPRVRRDRDRARRCRGAHRVRTIRLGPRRADHSVRWWTCSASAGFESVGSEVARRSNVERTPSPSRSPSRAKRTDRRIVAPDQLAAVSTGRVAVAVANRVVGLETERFPGRVTGVFVAKKSTSADSTVGAAGVGPALGGRQCACPCPRRGVVGGGTIAHLLEKLGGLVDLVGAHPAQERRNEHRQHDADEAEQERRFDQAQSRATAGQGRGTVRGGKRFGKSLAGVFEADGAFDGSATKK